MKKTILLSLLIASSPALATGFCEWDDHDCRAEQAQRDEMQRDLQRLQREQEQQRRDMEWAERERQHEEYLEQRHERRCKNEWGYDAAGGCK